MGKIELVAGGLYFLILFFGWCTWRQCTVGSKMLGGVCALITLILGAIAFFMFCFGIPV